jgi:hypothetical protein
MDSLPTIISGASFGTGTLGNIIEQMKQASYQNKIMGLLNNPAALAAMAAKLQQPLNNGLTQAVGNQVQGSMAERGLSQAPGIFAASQSQALAPYYQQNQNEAMNAVLQLLGMPAQTFKSPTNNSGSLQMLLKSLQPQQSGGGGYDTSGMTALPTIWDSSIPSFGGGSTVPVDPNFDSTWSVAGDS